MKNEIALDAGLGGLGLTSETITKYLLPKLDAQVEEFEKIKPYVDSDDDSSTTMVKIPEASTDEHRELAKMAPVAMGQRVVSAITDSLEVSGFTVDGRNSVDYWDIWKRGLMPGDKENALWHCVYSYGEGYVEMETLPLRKWRMNVKDVFRTTVFFENDDALNNEFPILAIERLKLDFKGSERVKITTDESVQVWTKEKGEKTFNLTYFFEHGLGVCPFVRYVDKIKANGSTEGQIKAIIPLLNKINHTSYISLTVAHDQGFQVRYSTGMSDPVAGMQQFSGETPEDFEERKAAVRRNAALKISTNKLLMGPENAKFGVLPAGDSGSIVDTNEKHYKELASVSNTPSDYLTGNPVGMTAEQSANGKQTWTQKIQDIKSRAGYRNVSLVKLAWKYENPGKEEPTGVSVSWKDSDAVVNGVIADSLVKEVQGIRMPYREAWKQLPNMNPEKYEAWVLLDDERIKKENSLQDLISSLNAKNASGNSPEETVNRLAN